MIEFSPAVGRLSERITLQREGSPDGFAELAVPLSKGEVVFYRWRADRQLDFNIHAHQGENVDYFLQSRTEELEGDFKATREDHFYLMWQNPSKKPVSFELEVWV